MAPVNPQRLAPARSAGHGQGLLTTCGACSHLRQAFVCHSGSSVSVRGAVREGLRARRLVLVLGRWTWPWKRVVRLPHERGTMMPSLRLLNQCVRGALLGGCARDRLGVECRAGHPVLMLKLSQPGLLHATMACNILAQQGPCRLLFSWMGHTSSYHWHLCPGWVRTQGGPGLGEREGHHEAGCSELPGPTPPGARCPENSP